METLNYKELKAEFKRKQNAEKKTRTKQIKTSSQLKENDDKRHNLETKQAYWQYLLNNE